MTPTPASQNNQTGPSRWPYGLAVGLSWATFPLISVGGLVTSYDAGMAVPDWPNTYGYNLLLYPWKTWLWGPWDLFLEHGHRLLGILVGLLAIGLVGAVFYHDARRFARVMAVVALVLVIAQGCLGGARVLLDDRQLAMLHGCFGPAFFAYCVAVASYLSPRARDASSAQLASRTRPLRRFTLLITSLVYVQLVLGAQMRHIPVTAGPWLFNMSLLLHLANALLLTTSIIVLGFSLGRDRGQAALRRPALWLVGLLSIQLFLGVWTWIVKYGWPHWFAGYSFNAGFTIQAKSITQTGIATLHMATGSLILAVALLAHLRTWQLLRLPEAARGVRRTVPELAK